MTAPLEMKAWLQTLNLQQDIQAPLQQLLVSSGEALPESDIPQCSYIELYASICAVVLWW